ncbi:hypothetical protein HZB88_05045, partial [archaeon]|nr:hypothetical protein [archaeon]
MQTNSEKEKLDKIDVAEICPKEWHIEQIDTELVKISYIFKGRGNQPKPIIMPKFIVIDEQLLASVGMYLGDGKLSRDNYHLEYTSKDKELSSFMLNFFKTRFLIKNYSFNYYYNDYSEASFKEWLIALGVNGEQVNKHQSDRHGHDCVSFQIGSKIFNHIFRQIILNILSSNFSKSYKLRRAFLSGLFAAEGSINYHHIERYIVYVGFHLSYVKEQDLAKLVMKLLQIEDINADLKQRSNRGEVYIRITSWQNYWKCYKIEMFNLCKRKKEHFLDYAKKAKYHVFVNDDFNEKMLENTNQRQLSLATNIYTPTMCISVKQKCFTLENMVRICLSRNISIEELKKDITKIRVGNNTEIDCREFVEFV